VSRREAEAEPGLCEVPLHEVYIGSLSSVLDLDGSRSAEPHPDQGNGLQGARIWPGQAVLAHHLVRIGVLAG
jgi:hypothetical protein